MKALTKLQKSLQAGQTVLIEFVKKDGSTRRARVTKNLSNIPTEKHPKGGKSSSKTITLFDTVKGDWICCYGDKITLVVPPLTASQQRRKEQARERWATAKRIVANYRFTVGEALKLASGKKVCGMYLENLQF